MILVLNFVTYIRMFLVIVTWHFPIRRFFPFLVSVTWNFQIWNLFTFLVGVYKKQKFLVFQIHLFRKRRNNQMAAVMLQVIPSFYTNYSKNSFFISANTYEKFIVSEEYCIARHDDMMCFLPICRYHIILIGSIKELLQKVDAFCFNYQHVDCLYKLFEYRFSDKIVIKSGQIFDKLQRAVHLNQQNRGVDKMPSIAKKRLLRKKYKRHLLSSF